MSHPINIRAQVNGAEVQLDIEPRMLLSDVLRDILGLKATKIGCEHGICGACTVLVDGRLVRSCLMFGVQIDGHEVRTLEGLRDNAVLSALAARFKDNHAVQCGYCTSGMLLTAFSYLQRNAYRAESLPDIRAFISGNLCRCTGYEAIVKSIAETHEAQRTGAE